MITELKEYLAHSSPISKLQKETKVPLKDIRNCVDLKMNLMKEHTKNYDVEKNKNNKRISKEEENIMRNKSNDEFLDMKASSIIYNIPEFSPPEINFQISDLLKLKINEIKDEIVTKLPTIKSSHYSSNKLEAAFSRRTVLKDLQDWLEVKLKNPPLTHEDSIEYKNMIMGVGMKEVIRLIGTRCAEEANLVNEIWELTWSICREIILHLSKRAHKCEKILEEEAKFFRNGCEKRMKDNDETVTRLFEENTFLKEKCERLSTEISKIKKKSKELKLTKMNLEEMNAELKEVFEATFKENLVLQLKCFPNDQSKIASIKKKYLTMLKSIDQNNLMFKEFLSRVLNETELFEEIEEVGEIELTHDMNQFKIEENQRRMQIDRELHEKLKTIEMEIQTDKVEVQNFSVETEKVEFQEASTETEKVFVSEFGVSVELLTEVSSKNSKAQRNSKVINVKEKKKSSIVSKIKPKISMNIEIGKEPLAEEFEIPSPQLGRSEKLVAVPKINEELEESDHEILISASQNNSAAQNSKDEGKADTEALEKCKRISALSVEKGKEAEEKCYKEKCEKVGKSKGEDMVFEENESLEISEKPHISEYLTEKQLEIDELKEELQSCENNYRNEFTNLNVELSSQNNIINNLKRELKALQKEKELKQEVKETVIEVREELEKSQQIQEPYHLEEEKSELEQLLRAKKYGQLIDSLLAITGTKLSDLQEKKELEESEEIDEINEKQVEENKIKKSKVSLEYQKKTFLPQKNLVERLSSHIEESEFSEESEKENEEVLTQNQIVSSSKRVSRRESTKSLTDLKSLKRKLREGKSKSINLIPQTFLEVITKYFFTYSQNWSQNGSAVKPVGNMTENNKRLTREQYKEMFKQINEAPQTIKNEKQMRTIIEKALNTILKELCKEIIIAIQKQGIDRAWELKMNYSPLYILMTNRFNMNYGVRKVASKHVKDLIISLKGIKKYTEKYVVISYFMLSSPSVASGDPILEYQDSELLFFYILLITLVEGLSADRSIEKSELIPISDFGTRFLTRDPKFISRISSIPEELEKESLGSNTFHNFYKRLISAYKDVWNERENEMKFIFLSLSKCLKESKSYIKWEDFVDFISVFNIRSDKKEYHQSNGWHYYVLTTMMQTILEEKSTDSSLISYEIYLKFVVKCPEFNVKIMQNSLSFIEGDSDLSDPNTQKKILSMCSSHDLIFHITKHLFESESLMEYEEDLWIRYVKCYILEKEVEEIIGGLGHGILDKRTKEIVLGKEFGNN